MLCCFQIKNSDENNAGFSSLLPEHRHWLPVNIHTARRRYIYAGNGGSPAKILFSIPGLQKKLQEIEKWKS